jgi:hypothetical protein
MRLFLGTLAVLASCTTLAGSPGITGRAASATGPALAAQFPESEDPGREALPPPLAADPPSPADPQDSTSGQWVSTSQYGWVWMPYGEAYTDVPPDGSTPSMFLYYPAAGWCWVMAPWLWGWGPSPRFGRLGASRFAWYGRGLGRWYGFPAQGRRPAWAARPTGFSRGGGPGITHFQGRGTPGPRQAGGNRAMAPSQGGASNRAAVQGRHR